MRKVEGDRSSGRFKLGARFRIVCGGCGRFIETVSEPEDASARLAEFIREHRTHFELEGNRVFGTFEGTVKLSKWDQERTNGRT